MEENTKEREERKEMRGVGRNSAHGDGKEERTKGI